MELKALLQARLKPKPQATCPVSILLTLSSQLPAYDLASNIRLLAFWLGPFSEPEVQASKAITFLLRSWKTLCLAEATGLTEGQVVKALIDLEKGNNSLQAKENSP